MSIFERSLATGGDCQRWMKKITVTIFSTNDKNCDDKVENRGFLCFKTSGVNGVLDIFQKV